MVFGKNALPIPWYSGPTQPALEHALEGSTTLFAAPAGFVSASRLSGLLHARQVPVVWLRAGREDRDPATLLLSLARGAETAFEGVGERTLERMRAHPGPVSGWAPLFSGLARDIADAAADRPDLCLVIQHIDRLYNTPAALSLLHNVFLPLLPASTASILISHTAPLHGSLPGYIVPVTTRDLRLSEVDALALADDCFHAGSSPAPSLPEHSLRRMIGLSEGCVTALAGICSAYSWLGGQTLCQVIDAATGRIDLLARISRCCLQTYPQPLDDLLGLAFRMEYLRPEVTQGALNLPAAACKHLLNSGWLQALEGGDYWLNCVWHEPLHRVLRLAESVQCRAVKLAAEYLIRSGSEELAITLLLDLRCYDEATDALAQTAEAMMNLGQWDTLSTWLAALPQRARRDRPWLMYIEGELAATRGDTRAAQRSFASATRQFTARSDPSGACSSLLAESILAARQNRDESAGALARQVQQLAGEASLAWFQAWAGWQLGCLAACAGRLAEAVDHFQRACEAVDPQQDPSMSGFIGQALEMAQTILRLQQELARRRQAAEETTQAGREAAERMRFLLQKPARPAAALLGEHGWARVPLSLKLPADYAPQFMPTFEESTAASAAGTTALDGFSGLLRGWMNGLLDRLPGSPERLPAQIPVTSGPPEAVKPPVIEVSNEEPTRPRKRTGPSGEDDTPETAREPVKQPMPAAQPVISVYLLGRFRVVLDQTVIEHWPGGHSRAVLAYLLAQHGHPVPRDLLMDTFWPEAGLEAARNSLNVAVYGLRQALKQVVRAPVILYREAAYQINPDLAIWIDVAEFEQHVRAAQQSERSAAGPTAVTQAVREYEMAVSLYQGDFLDDIPYEDWTILERERLRVMHLDSLDRLSLVYFNQGQYGACISLCQRMLSYDACREDTHCRLMRCFGRQEQAHLALRQYQACVEALRDELDVPPSPATSKLYEQIKRQEAV